MMPIVINDTEPVSSVVLAWNSSQSEKTNMLVERHQVLRIVTALEQQLKKGNLSVRNRQKLKEQIASMRLQYPNYFAVE